MGEILSVAISGLEAAQRLISTTAENVSNSAKPGYRRRTTELFSRPDVTIGGKSIGTGVAIGMTKRTVDDIQQGIYRQNLSTQNEFSARAEFSDQINQLLSGADTSISNAINEFFTAMQQLANDPANATNRGVLLSQADALAKKVNSMDGRLQDLVDDMNFQTQSCVTEMNSIANSLVKLNKEIMNITNSGVEPSTLLDQRDLLVDRLSEIVSVQTIEQTDGSLNVFVGNSQALVIGVQQMTYGVIHNPDDPSRLDIQNTLGGTRTVTNDIVGGTIGGLRSIRDEIIDATKTRINRVVMSFANSINVQHKLGLDRNGEFGGDLFTDYNSYLFQVQRTIPNSLNEGTAQFAVRINDIAPPQTGPYKTYSAASNLVNTGGLLAVNANDLIINGVTVRAPVVGDDTVSTVDNARSAIAIAAAINDSVGAQGITATAEINSLNLGTFTPGAFAAGNFLINGVNIVTLGGDEATLLRDINAETHTTGVRAVGDGNLNITLVADDGRNIRLGSNGTAVATTFQYLSTNGLAVLDKVQRGAISLTCPTSAITVAGATPANAGLTAGTTPAVTSSLTDSDYLLSFDGTNYTLTRQSDDVVVANTTSTTFSAEGMTISLNNGAAIAGDNFIVRPTTGAANNFSVLITDAKKLAMASPIRVEKTNTGGSQSTAKITRGAIVNATGQPITTAGVLGNAFTGAAILGPPIKVVFYNDDAGQPTLYRVYDVSTSAAGVQIGPDQPYNPNAKNEIFPLAGVTNHTFPGPNPTYVYDPGYRVSITGTVVAGDAFNISLNTNSLNDSGNAAEFTKLQSAFLLSGNTSTYQGEYNNLISDVGAIAHSDDTNYNAAESLVRSAGDGLKNKTGVNLDEEATNIIKLHQYYQANAQVVAMCRTMFDSLLAAVAA